MRNILVQMIDYGKPGCSGVLLLLHSVMYQEQGVLEKKVFYH